jgi:hypothetical protein
MMVKLSSILDYLQLYWCWYVFPVEAFRTGIKKAFAILARIFEQAIMYGGGSGRFFTY